MHILAIRYIFSIFLVKKHKFTFNAFENQNYCNINTITKLKIKKYE